MRVAGVASASATERFRQRFASLDPSHFRPLQDLWVSSIGLGTYLGDCDDRTDALYAQAIRTAVTHGCNVVDTAINYRCQRSERTIGQTLESLIAEGVITRDELVLCTKGGYLPFDGEVPKDPGRYLVEHVINPGLASHDEIVAGCHCLSPAYLEHALETSLRNLRVQTIDIYYLHNPEQQLDEVNRETFLQRLEAAFATLEAAVREGRVRYYGTATWHGYRCNAQARGYLSLEALVDLAVRMGGAGHHFRVIQLPYNLAMPEAFAFRNQTVHGETVSVLEAAQRLGLSVVASASLLQGRLAQLGAGLAQYLPQTGTDSQRAVQFARSTPGVTTALIGMKQRRHVEENLALARQPLLTDEQIRQLFDRRRTTWTTRLSIWIGLLCGLLSLMGCASTRQMMVVAQPVADVRSQPHTVAQPNVHDPLEETQLLYGERVRLVRREDNWAKVEAVEQAEYTHRKRWQSYPGWVGTEALIPWEESLDPTIVITTKWARLWRTPYRTDEAPWRLPLGSQLRGVDFGGALWRADLLDGSSVWIDHERARSLNELRTLPVEMKRQLVLRAAEQFLGDPYYWGGRSPFAGPGASSVTGVTGVDCSGLVNLAYRTIGMAVPRDAHEQFLRARPVTTLRPADLVFLSEPSNPRRIVHVMLYADGGTLIEGPGTGQRVRRIPVAERLGQPVERLVPGAIVNDQTVSFGAYLP